jgi:hypothetical protein
MFEDYSLSLSGARPDLREYLSIWKTCYRVWELSGQLDVLLGAGAHGEAFWGTQATVRQNRFS